MASSSKPTARTTSSAKDTCAPLIPQHKKFVYRPAPMTRFANEIVEMAKAARMTIDIPRAHHPTVKLGKVLCSAAKVGIWSRECEKALVEALPLREHHKAFLSHNMFATIIGALVARVLDQATGHLEDNLDLLADRYYVRSIACHDSSKTSAIEASSFAAIMAVHAEKEARAARGKKLQRYRDGAADGTEDGGEDAKTDLRADLDIFARELLDIGLEHHHGKNPHHPEHVDDGEMSEMNLVKAIVDGLACIFERNKDHVDALSWLNTYDLDVFKGDNKGLAQNIFEALKTYVTEADYKALRFFRLAVFSIVGESSPWSRVVTAAGCCIHNSNPVYS